MHQKCILKHRCACFDRLAPHPACVVALGTKYSPAGDVARLITRPQKPNGDITAEAASALALSQVAFITTAEAAPRQSLIPPVVLQGCSEKVNAEHSSWLVGGLMGRAAGGNAQEAQTVGFDLSFVNTSQKVANLVLIRVGQTDFAKTGMFSPNAVIAWRIALKTGSECAIRAVRFDDGSEWDVSGT